MLSVLTSEVATVRGARGFETRRAGWQVGLPTSASSTGNLQLQEFVRQTEALVDASGLRNSDREPACRMFLRNEWVKVTEEYGLNEQPDRLPQQHFGECITRWVARVGDALARRQQRGTARKSASSQPVRRLPRAA